MTIRSHVRGGTNQQQPTSSSAYYKQLNDRLTNQAAMRVPRSPTAWGIEQARLGSWASGLGAFRPSGIGTQQAIGRAEPLFDYSQEAQESNSAGYTYSPEIEDHRR